MGIIAVAQYTIKSISESLTYDGAFDRGIELWSQSKTDYSAPTNTVVKKDETSEYGGNVLEITNEKWLYAKDYIPLRKERIYKLTFRVKQKTQPTDSSKNKCYAGFYLTDSTHTALSGTGLYGGNVYFTTAGSTTPSEWKTYEGYASVTSTPKNGVTTLPSNAAYFKPMFIVNYQQGNGIAIVDSLVYEDVTDTWNKVDNDSESVFNALTNNGKVQGLYLENNKLYMNGEYIRARNLSVVNDSNVETLKIDSKGEVKLNVKNFTLSTGGSTNVPTNTQMNTAINNVTVGTRNYALKTGEKFEVTGTNSTNQTGLMYHLNKEPILGKEVTISFDWEVITENPSGTFRLHLNATPYTMLSDTITVTGSNKKGSSKKTVTMPVETDAHVGHRLDNFTGKVVITNLKIESGIRKSDWSPAPEDIEKSLENKVNNDEVITTINSITMDEDSIKINANALNITGAVTFSSLHNSLSENFVNEGDTTVINGGTIKAGTLELTDHVKATGLQIYNDKEQADTFTITKEGYVTMRGDISSFNFSDTDGWKIFANGDAVFNSGEFRSKIMLPGAGMTNDGSASNAVRIYAGVENYADRESAPFKVLANGDVYALNGHFGGTFSGKLEVGNIFIEDSEATKGRASITIKNNTNTITHVEIAEDVSEFNTDFKIREKFWVDNSGTFVKGAFRGNETFELSKNYMFFQTQNDKKYYFKFMPYGELDSDGNPNTEDYFAFKSKKENEGEDFVFSNIVSGRNANVRVKGDLVADNSVQIGKVLIKKDSKGATISIV